MRLITLHRILIATSIALFVLYGALACRDGRAGLGRATASFAAAAGLGYYLHRLRGEWPGPKGGGG